MEFCVKKAPPHDYTDQCEKLGDKGSALKYIAAKQSEWNSLKKSLNAYCAGATVAKHNIENCEILKKRAETLGASAAASAPAESETAR